MSTPVVPSRWDRATSDTMRSSWTPWHIQWGHEGGLFIDGYRTASATPPAEAVRRSAGMSAAESVPLPVLLAAVAAMQAVKEADAVSAFTLPTPLYMQLIKATSGLAYYTDRLVAERIVVGQEDLVSWSTEEVQLLVDYFHNCNLAPSIFVVRTKTAPTPASPGAYPAQHEQTTAQTGNPR